MWEQILGGAMSLGGAALGLAGGEEKGTDNSAQTNQLMNNANYALGLAGDSYGRAETYSPIEELQYMGTWGLMGSLFGLDQFKAREQYQDLQRSRGDKEAFSQAYQQLLPQIKEYNELQNQGWKRGLAFADKAYDETEYLMDLARPVNDSIQQRRLSGLSTLQNLSDQANSFDTEAYANRAYADTIQQFNNSDAELARTMAQMGISPSSQAYKAALASQAGTRAMSAAQAINAGRKEGEDTKFSRRSSLGSTLAGLSFDDTAVKAASVAPKPTAIQGSIYSPPQTSYANAQAFPMSTSLTSSYYNQANSALNTANSALTDSSKSNSSEGNSSSGLSSFGGQMFGSGLGMLTNSLKNSSSSGGIGSMTGKLSVS